MLRIKELRKKQGLTQRELADLLSRDQTTVSAWECGLAAPTAEKLPEIAKLLNCTINDLFEEGEANELYTGSDSDSDACRVVNKYY